VDFLPVTDPLLREPELRYGADLAVLGTPVRFATNSRRVAEITMESFGCGPTDDAIADDARPDPLAVRIIVHDGEEPGTDGAGHAPVRHLCPDGVRIAAHSPGSMAISDPARREVIAWVTTSLVRDAEHFRDALLEAMVLSLVTHFDRHPLHAAAIVQGGRVLLLAGPSGSGKSTLSYVAHRAGVGLLSDDHVWVQLEPALRVWGRPSGVRLLPEAPRRFPELAGHHAAWRGGKTKLHVRLDDTGRDASAGDVRVCLLRRGGATASLRVLDARAVALGLTRRVDAGFDRYPARHERVVADLSRQGGWELELSDDPDDALPLLRRMLEEGR
jgi:hypothetical protein